MGLEVMIVHKGLVLFETSNREHLIASGEVVFTEGSRFHRARPLGPAYYRTVIHFTEDFLHRDTLATFESLVRNGEGVARGRLGPDGLRRCFWAANELLGMQETGNRIGGAAVRHLLGLIIAETETTVDSASLSSEASLVANALGYLTANLDDETLSIAKLAKTFYVSETHLRTLFQKYVGKSPREYALNLKVQKAQEYLSTTGISHPRAIVPTGF